MKGRLKRYEGLGLNRQMEDTIVILISLFVVTAAGYWMLRMRKNFHRSSPPEASQNYFLFKRKGRVQIPWVTMLLAALLIFCYVIDPPQDPRMLILKELQKNNLIFTPVTAALATCDHEPHDPFCTANVSTLQSLLKRASAQNALNLEDLKTLSKGLVFYGNWQVAHPRENTQMSQTLAKEESQFREIVRRVRALSNGTLSKENFSMRNLFLAQFSHANPLHLINNVLALVLFGCLAEGWLGSTLYLVTYVLGGTMALLIYVKLFAAPGIHVLGASANVSTIVAAYVYFRMKLGLTQFRRVSSSLAQALFLFYYYFGSDVMGVAQKTEGVAFGAHLLGATLGALILFVSGTPPVSDKLQENQISIKAA